MSLFTTSLKNKQLLLFFLLGIVTFCLRAYINFSSDLLIGNGGYYPLQVRTILERGELAFQDMPLLFYLDAGIIKFLSLFDPTVSDQLIINVVQVVDSISIPLLLIYHILKLSKNDQASYFPVLIVAYAVFSFYTLTLTSTSQKNSLGITFLFYTMFWLIKHLKTDHDKKYILLAVLFLILTGFTHFGTFVFATFTGIIYLGFRFKHKAIIPLLTLLTSSLFIIYWFDPTRLLRLISVVDNLFTELPKPPQIIFIIIYGTLAFLSIKAFKKYNVQFGSSDIIIIKTLIALLIIIPLPIIHPQFTDRMMLFLFIPQVLLLLYFAPVISSLAKRILTSIIGLILLTSVLFSILIGSPQSLSKAAVEDLKNLETGLAKTEKTVIITRHNLEFWVAWTLKVDVSQESKFDSLLINEYDHIFLLNQTKGLHKKEGPPRDKGRNHFDEPIIPISAVLVDSSEYFKLYRFK